MVARETTGRILDYRIADIAYKTRSTRVPSYLSTLIKDYMNQADHCARLIDFYSETENKLHSIEPRVNVINTLRLPRRYGIFF